MNYRDIFDKIGGIPLITSERVHTAPKFSKSALKSPLREYRRLPESGDLRRTTVSPLFISHPVPSPLTFPYLPISLPALPTLTQAMAGGDPEDEARGHGLTFRWHATCPARQGR